MTATEVELMDLAAAGFENQQMADCVGLGYGTVKMHLDRVFRRMGVKNKAEMVYWAMRSGVIL